ncbi:MAG TPA: VUT family protein, partial [Candidatus Methylomirabilis sp.]|nr:VUT family protein [Candidatus Methylomirabilis sp.]
KWARVLSSNAVSTLVDSALFITIAFAGALPVWPLIGGQYLVKMGVTLISLPLIYAARGPARAMEQGA